MTRDELEKRNVGENLDALMNLDPRGYGVCRILYAGSRAYTGEPLTMHAAQVLFDAVKENDLVYIITDSSCCRIKCPRWTARSVPCCWLARW